MPLLKQLQESFCGAVYDNDKQPLSDFIKKSDIDNSNRIKIYQDNVLLTLSDTMQNRYGAICKLVGEKFFSHIVNEYIKLNKPNSGNLDDYGEGFPEFISNIPQLKDFPYLSDVAKLEWALHIAYFAADTDEIDKDALSKVEPEKLEDIKFTMHPSACLISSKYPIDKIWEISQDDYEGDVNIDIASGGVDILVIRPEFKIITITLENGDYKLLNSLQSGCKLSDAFELACEDNEEYDIGKALQKFVLNGTFVKYSF
jgi:hypothetical protein